MRRALLLAALGAAALPAAAAPAASAASTARFVVSVEGRQVTTWKQPRHQFGTADCKGTPYRTAGGSETATFRTKPARLLAYRPNPRAGVALLYGTWDRFAAGRGHLDATGRVTRAFTETIEWVAGPCGAPDPPAPAFSDCGTARSKPEVRLNWLRGRVEVASDSGPGGVPYLACDVRSAPGVEDGDVTDGIRQRYPERDLFDTSQGLVEVLGRRTFSATIDRGNTTTTVTWKIRLRRAR